MASRESLSFVCVWTQKPGDDNKSFLTAYERFFEAHRGQASVSIERVQKRLPRDSCEDPLWQVHCKLHLYKPLKLNALESLSIDIARQWCSSGGSGDSLSGHLQWLQPDRRYGFWHHWYAMEKDIRMRSISFGTFSSLNLFAERHCIESKPRGEQGYTIDCTFKHDERVLQVFLELNHCGLEEDLYRLSVHYNSIFRVVVYDPVGGPTDVFLHLHTLPLFYKAAQPGLPAMRLLQITRQETVDQMDFQRTLEMGCFCCSVLESRDVGGCFVVKLGFADSHEARRTVGRLSRRCRRAQFIFAPVKTRRIGKDADALRQQLCSRLMPKLKFPCCYALNALLQRSDDVTMQLMLLTKAELDVTLSQLESFASHNEGALEETLFGIGTALENHSIVTFSTALPALFAKVCQSHVPYTVPRGSCLVRRLFVTPSRVFYLPPAIHSENRVLRKFDVDHALRVSFRDDHFEVLSHTLGFHPRKGQMMDKVVGRFLRDGLKIGDRHFRLLASSVSQLRDHGVWLYADDHLGNTVESIRDWMGDFSTLPNVAKKIARMGQCFSTTEESVTVPLHGETMEDAADIEGGTHPESGKPYVFSDGIGMISQSLMEKVCSKLDLEQVPSAIQIRYAGYKGMLCTNNTLEGDKLILRKSMNKFACSTSDSLEVIKVSAPSPVFLNRPLITILEQLGVPGRVFLGLQQNMVLQLCDAFVSNETALNVLCTYTNASLPFLKLHLRGMALSREPFTRSLLLAVYKSMIVGLQEKSRIAIPVDSGRNMLGVLDETGTLEYGQVFVQYTAMGARHGVGTCQNGAGDTSVSNTKVLTGTVLVTKCPCLHPGDVRKFEAVDVPALRHIRDCIVFPAKGPRPHPNEMAGSDLDGDEYIVIWEKDLYFPGGNRTPMTFSDTSVGAQSTGDLNEDIIQFLCKYILNDSVGIMSNAHLAWADQHSGGIFSDVCLSLARKISVCLDFAKTGISEALSRTERPQQYPDFMNKRGVKVNYRSLKVLGELYRLNKTLVGSGSVAYTAGDFHQALFEYPGWQRHEGVAEKAKATYAWLMSQILNQHGIESEAEVVTGIISSVSRYNKSKQDKTSVETLVAKQYRALVATMQDQFLADVNAASQGDTKRTLLEMASAWYMVTCNDVWREENSLGLPWCIPDNLLLLLRERSGGLLLERPPTQSLLVEKIDSHCANGSSQDVAFNLLCQWAQNEELLRASVLRESQVCESCFRRAFEQYVSNERAESAGGYVSGFLRYLTTVPTALPVCPGCSSASRQVHVLTLAALHCYSRLVVSRDVCCFGLPCDVDHDWAQEIQESEPIRINTQTGTFLDMVQKQPDLVQELLCRWTGVQEVNIRVYSYRSRRHRYLLLSAVGRLWQLCCFEELVTQSGLENAIVRKSLC